MNEDRNREEQLDDSFEAWYGNIGDQVKQKIGYPTWTEGFATSLIQRFATVEEVADTIVFLSSVNARAINGNVQRVEGGIIQSIL